MTRRLIVFDCKDIRVLDPSQISELDKGSPGDLFLVLIDGDVIASGRLTVVGGQLGYGQQPSDAAKPTGKVSVVLDQMFRGYYPDVIEREEPSVELHVIVGRGVQGTQQASPRRYLEEANDDFDVLKVVEREASRSSKVIFFTGDKRLASQASAATSQLGNVEVHYMPPNEFPGKESLAKAMLDVIRRALAS